MDFVNKCPGCGNDKKPNPRYKYYLCESCSNNVVIPSNEKHIYHYSTYVNKTLRYTHEEARFGGTVMQLDM